MFDWASFIAWPGWGFVGATCTFLTLTGVAVTLWQFREQLAARPREGIYARVSPAIPPGAETTFTVRGSSNVVMYEATPYVRGLPVEKIEARAVMTAESAPFVFKGVLPHSGDVWIGIVYLTPRGRRGVRRGARMKVLPAAQRGTWEIWKTYRFPRFHRAPGRWVPRRKLGPREFPLSQYP